MKKRVLLCIIIGSSLFLTSFLNCFANQIVYSTYFGGTHNSSDKALAITTDNSGNIYVTGSCASTDFPTTPGAFKTSVQDSNNIFVSKFDSTGALIYSTFIGGGGNAESANDIAVDSEQNVYITGVTNSNDFPTTPGAFQNTAKGSLSFGGQEAFVLKLNPSGTNLVYSTYLGGTSSEDIARGIAVDNSGNAYVTGYTLSSDFPVTSGAFMTRKKDLFRDGFVTKINPTGTNIIYSTFLGGSFNDGAYKIAVDSTGNAYVVGGTGAADFPITSGAFQTRRSGTRPNTDLFISKLNPEGSALVYSTYLGGSEEETSHFSTLAPSSYDISIDTFGNAYVTGTTMSTDFPTTPGALQASQTSASGAQYGSAFVSKLNPTGSALIYSTYLGPTSTSAQSLQVDNSGNAYITGTTRSNSFPTTTDAIKTSLVADSGDAFVSVLNPTGQALSYSTYLGGTMTYYSLSDSEVGYGIAVDSMNNIFVAGETFSFDFPIVNPVQNIRKGLSDAFISKIGETSVGAGLAPANSSGIGAGLAPANSVDTFTISLNGSALNTTSALNITVNPGSAMLASGVNFQASGATLLLSDLVPGAGIISVVWSGNISDGKATIKGMISPTTLTPTISVTKIEAAGMIDLTSSVTANVTTSSSTPVVTTPEPTTTMTLPPPLPPPSGITDPLKFEPKISILTSRIPPVKQLLRASIIKVLAKGSNFSSTSKCQIVTSDKSVLTIKPTSFLLSPKVNKKLFLAKFSPLITSKLISSKTSLSVTINAFCDNGAKGQKEILLSP